LNKLIDRHQQLDMKEIDAAITTTFATFGLSSRQIRNIITLAVANNKAKRRNELTEKQIFDSLASVTGLEYELILVTDPNIYTQDDFEEELLDESVIRDLSNAWSVPSDGRVDLSFTMDSLLDLRPPSKSVPHPIESTKLFNKLLEGLNGDFCIIDWGWPTGQWRPSVGLPYRLSTKDLPRARDLWQQHRKTCGPRRKITGYGKPWQRLM
jgi:hypothetical protein